MSALGSMSSLGAPTGGPTAVTTAVPARTYTVQRGTVEDVLSFSGQVAPVQSKIDFVLDGVIAKLYVQPGQTIQKGDLVAELDVSELATQLRDAKLSYEQNQRDLDRATATSQLVVKQAELDVEEARQILAALTAPAAVVKLTEAQTAVRAAQANLETVRNNASQTKNSAQATFTQAVRKLQTIQAQYGELSSLLQRTSDPKEQLTLSDNIKALETTMREAEGSIAQAQIAYDTARNNEVSAVKDAEAKLDLTKAQLTALLAGPDQFQVATQERVVRRAELALSKAQLESKPDPALSRAVSASRLQIQGLEEQIAAKQLFAPYGGEVATIATSLGTTVQSGTPVITLVDRSRLEILADSTAIDNGERKKPVVLNLGQPVAVSFSRYPGQVLSGTISFTPDAQQLAGTDKNYHIGFDPQGLSLDVGDLSDLRVSLGRKYDTLWLPLAAVKISGTRNIVVIRTDGKDKSLDVLTGLITTDKIEILSGLKENDIVIGQ